MRRVYENGYSEYGIHEVYYNDNGKVEGWTEDAIAPTGENINELKQTLERMALAAKKSVLDYTNGKEIKSQKKRRQPKKKNKAASRNRNV